MHLVVDLDETLVSVSSKPNGKHDFSFILNGVTYYAKKRPGLELFLRFIFRNFETVSIWTAATREYANKVVRNIMTDSQIGSLAFFKSRRDLATDANPTAYYKPLRAIFGDPIARQYGILPQNTIMIDDRRDVMRDNPGNGIIIPPYNGVPDDKYLLKLIIVLDGVLRNQLVFGHFAEVIDLSAIVDDPASAPTAATTRATRSHAK